MTSTRGVKGGVLPRKARTVEVEPWARAMAESNGIELGTVVGTGPRGGVTRRDVSKAIFGDLIRDEQTASRRSEVSTSSRKSPSLILETNSYWGSGATRLVEVDAYSPNPLLDDIRTTAPEQCRDALSLGPAPTLFAAGGDLPLFTVSGLDPALLRKLPWIARPAAAQADAARASQIFEQFGEVSVETWDAAVHQHCLDISILTYENRFLNWSRRA